MIHRTVTGAQHDDIEVVSGGDTATPALKLALATTLHLELQLSRYLWRAANNDATSGSWYYWQLLRLFIAAAAFTKPDDHGSWDLVNQDIDTLLLASRGHRLVRLARDGDAEGLSAVTSQMSAEGSFDPEVTDGPDSLLTGCGSTNLIPGADALYGLQLHFYRRM